MSGFPINMHEVGIMASTLDVILRQAGQHHASRVHRVVLRIGVLSGVEPDSLRFAFEAVTRDTIAAGAELAIESVPARAYCAACTRDFGVDQGFIFACPECGQLSGELRSGRELELIRLEMS
ncbi:MAG: hydrogenase maturation nickel metallochaperone HypA [Opitutales bacterium]